MGEAVSLGIHESQSRLWENPSAAAGRSGHWFPMARRDLPRALADVDARARSRRGQPRRAVADPRPGGRGRRTTCTSSSASSWSRRCSGDLAVADLPAAWNEKYREYLGVTPANDAEGCLQDIHWSAGLIGYFPTYTLGNLYAAQLFAAGPGRPRRPRRRLRRGEFAGLLGWLREKIHRQGQRYRPAELIERITGSRPDHRPLIDGLRRSTPSCTASDKN